jgi:hypothetical protein
MSSDNQARGWLRWNGYDDIADEIEAIMEEWKGQRKKDSPQLVDALTGSRESMLLEHFLFRGAATSSPVHARSSSP